MSRVEEPAAPRRERPQRILRVSGLETATSPAADLLWHVSQSVSGVIAMSYAGRNAYFVCKDFGVLRLLRPAIAEANADRDITMHLVRDKPPGAALVDGQAEFNYGRWSGGAYNIGGLQGAGNIQKGGVQVNVMTI